MARPRSTRTGRGFSLPFVLIAASILLIGGLMLAMRSSDGLLSVLLQGESSDAHDAAETGLTRILAELNLARNRGLLVKDGSDQDSDLYLWGRGDADHSRNPCLPRSSSPVAGKDPNAPDLTNNPDVPNDRVNPNIGFTETNPPVYSTVLLNDQGQVITDPAAAPTAVKSYRLVAVRRQPLRSANDGSSLRLFEANGRGTVVLTVEGSALRHGRPISTVRLEEELQLVPKCCGASFGGAHGMTNYGPDSQGRSVCIATGWGFVAGMARNDSGAITINGFTTIHDDSGALVDPLLCVASGSQFCDFHPTSTAYTLQLVQPSSLRQVRTNPSIPATVMGRIGRDTVPQDYPTAASPQPFLHCTIPGVTPASLKQCPNAEVTINADAATALLPRNEVATPETYCGVANYGDQDDPESSEALHCNLSELDYSQLTIEVVNTGARALRLYFPESGDVIRSTGGGLLEHRGSAARFALFGCSGCDAQSIRLSGSAEGLSLFAWFPRGTVTVGGASGYQGVLWANVITSSGGVTWTIPAAGLLSVLELAGFGLEGERNPPTFDWVARSIRSFRWLGQ